MLLGIKEMVAITKYLNGTATKKEKKFVDELYLEWKEFGEDLFEGDEKAEYFEAKKRYENNR
ncbi:MAG: hypothetical protein IJ283_01485 [Oscillospiraceae bacterium]|nr:hypothetical protein [Oscillospiraceae bacterium]